jgi:hypothetical protein
MFIPGRQEFTQKMQDRERTNQIKTQDRRKTFRSCVINNDKKKIKWKKTNLSCQDYLLLHLKKQI